MSPTRRACLTSSATLATTVCAKIAAGDGGLGEATYPVVTTLDVALDKINDAFKSLNGKAA